MGNTYNVLSEYLQEFIPAMKVECLIVGVSLMIISACMVLLALTSGLSGQLTYLTFNPGCTAPLFVAGAALCIWALVAKKPQ